MSSTDPPSAGAHSRAAKEHAAEAGSQPAASVKEASKAAFAVSAQAGASAQEGATDAAAAAKDKLSEVGGEVHSALHSAVEFVKERLPAVVHTEESAVERQAQALLDESMGRPAAYDAQRPTPAASAAAEANRPHASGLVGGATAAGGGGAGAGRPADAALSAPPELQARLEREELSARTPLQAATDKLSEAADYVRARRERAHLRRSGEVHEVSALPGDIHVPLVARALREKVFHKGTAATTVHPGQFTATVAGAHPVDAHDALPPPEHEPSVVDRAAGVYEDAKHRAGEAARTAEGKAAGAAHSVGDALGAAYHAVADPVAGTLHSLEDRAKAARDSVADTAQRWRQEVEPRSEGEAKLAHGDIPYSTAELLGIHAQEKAKGGAAQEEQDPRPKAAAGWGGETLAPQGAGKAAAGAAAAVAPEASRLQEEVRGLREERHGLSDILRESVRGVDKMEPGSEGELPS